MRKLKVRNIVLGEGIPKICVPIVGKTFEEIKQQAEEIVTFPIDLVEWRMDWYENVGVQTKVKEVLACLRQVLGEVPLLATFRTKQEGGEQDFTKEQYCDLMNAVITSGYADLADIELFMGDELMRGFVETAHQNGVFIIASNHDFEKTPKKEEMIQRLCKMQELGADVLKIAVMPQSGRDVLTVLDMTLEMKERYAEKPLITMAMSGLGAVSRLAGECFGSAVTFGAAKQTSAPGQIRVNELKKILEILHK
ncbi:MAG: type I 3-dehydroquinate dehydratase [Candidatus Fimimorpha sp.]